MAKKINDQETDGNKKPVSTGIRTFLKEDMERSGVKYTEEKVDKVIKAYEYDYDKIINDAGNRSGVKDIDSFRNEIYSHYGFQKDEEHVAEIDFLKKPTETEASGYDRYTQLQDDLTLAQSMSERLKPQEEELSLMPDFTQPSDVTRVDKPFEAVLAEDKLLTPEQQQIRDVSGQKEQRVVNLQSKMDEINTAVAEQAKLNIKEFGYASKEHENVVKEFDNYSSLLKTALVEIEDSSAKHAFGFGFGPGTAAYTPEGAQNVRSIEDLTNIKELYSKMGKILGAPQGEKFTAQMDGLLHGFSDNFFTKDFATLGLSEMGRLLNVKDAFDTQKKLEGEGKTKEEIAQLMPEEQKALLAAYQQLLEIQAGTKGNFGSIIGEGLKEMIPFIAQFAATGGVGTTAKKVVKEFIEAKTKSAVAGRIAGAIAKPLAQAAAMIPTNLQGYAQRVAPTMDAEGNLIEGMKPLNAAVITYFNTFAEVVGEDAGVFTNKMGSKIARKSYAKLIAGNPNKAQKILGKLSLALTRETNMPGIQGSVFEIFGEEVTGIMQAVINQDGSFFTSEAQSQILALSIIASGTFYAGSIPNRIRTKAGFNKARNLLNDIPNGDYAKATEDIAKNYDDPVEAFNALNVINEEFEISKEDFLKARNFIGHSARYNQMNITRAIQVEHQIARSKGNDGNVTLATYNDALYSVRNPENLGKEGKVVYLKSQDGTTITPVISSKVTDWESKSPDVIIDEHISQEDIQDEAFEQQQQIEEEAIQKGLVEGKTVETPNGKRKFVSINTDGTAIVTNDKGEEEIVNISEIEAYKTKEQQEAEKEAAKIDAETLLEGIEEGATVTSDEPLTDESEVRVVDFSNGQSKIITPEGEQVFNTPEERDVAITELVTGEIEALDDIDTMPADQAFSEMRKTNPEIADEIFTEEINEVRAQAEEARAKVTETKSRKEKQNLLLQAKELDNEAERLDAILKDPTLFEQEVEQEVVAEPLTVDETAGQLNQEYLTEKESTPFNLLEPWQQDLLGTKISREQFIRAVGSKFASEEKDIASRWYVSKKKETGSNKIDTIAQELSEDHNVEVTPQDVIDFILENPTNSVRKTTNRMNDIAAEYKDLTGKTIKKHIQETAQVAEDVEGFEVTEDVPFRTEGVNVTEKAQEDIKHRSNAIKELNKLQEKFGIPIEVINSEELSEEAKAKARKVGAPKAFYQTGIAYILSDQITSVSDVKKSYMHEALVHKGLDLVFEQGPVTLLGKTYDTKNDLLDDMFARMDEKTIADRAKIYANVPLGELTDIQKRELAEEALATLSETESPRLQVMFDKLYNYIKKLLGFTSKQFTKADLRNMLREHRDLVISLKKGADVSGEVGEQVKFRTTESITPDGDDLVFTALPSFDKVKTKQDIAEYNAKIEIINILFENSMFSQDKAEEIDYIDGSDSPLEALGDMRYFEEIVEEKMDEIDQLEDDDLESGEEKVSDFVDELDFEADKLGLEDLVKQSRPVTDNIGVAGYVLPSGEMLDFSDGAGARYADHRSLNIPIKEGIQGTDLMEAFKEQTGAVRMDYEGGMIDMNSRPTYDQLSVIRKIIRNKLGDYAIDMKDGDRELAIQNAPMDFALNKIDQFYDDKTLGTGDKDVIRFRVAESKQELDDFVKDSSIKETVYHGTPNALFDEFREGTMFTKNKTYAERYINQGASSVQYKKTAEKPGVYSTKLNLKNPFDTRNEEARDIFEGEYRAMLSPELSERGLVYWMEADDLAEWLQENYPEYDGLVLDEGGEPVMSETQQTEQYQTVEDGIGWRGESYYIFNPEQALVESIEDVDDVKFRILGKVGAERLDDSEEATIRLDNLQVAKEMEAEGIEPVFKKAKEAFIKVDELNEAEDFDTDRSAIEADYNKLYQRLGYADAYSADRDVHRAIHEALKSNDVTKLPEPLGDLSIRMATGWERGADGKWKYEVGDVRIKNMSRFEEIKKNSLFEHDKVDLVGYEINPDGTYKIHLRGKDATSTTKGFISFSSLRKKELSNYLGEEIAAAIRKGNAYKNDFTLNLDEGVSYEISGRDFNFESENGIALPDLVDDKTLFTEYPTLKDVVVYFDEKYGRGAALITTNAGYEYIGLGTKIPLTDKADSQINSILNHEIQHAIQFIEGFAPGGNRDMMSEGRYYNLAKRAGLTDGVSDKAIKYEIYRRTAGEVESRNVQSRLGMTPEERQKMLLEDTADVAKEDQVFMQNGIAKLYSEIKSEDVKLRAINENIEKCQVCDRMRTTPEGEAFWQEMMSTKESVSEEEFLENSDVTDILDEDEAWEDYLATQQAQDEVEFYKSANGAYFFQTAGFEFIWKTKDGDPSFSTDIKDEDITKFRVDEEAVSKGLKIFDNSEYNSYSELIDGVKNGDLLVHSRTLDEKSVDDLKYGLFPEIGETILSTESYQAAEEAGIPAAELIFASDNFGWAKTRSGFIFIKKDGFQKYLGNNKVELPNGEQVDYEMSPIAVYEDEALRSLPVGVELGDWFSNEESEVIAAAPFNYTENEVRFRVEEQRDQVETAPSEDQKSAGNYKMGHVKFDGFDITIENPRGSIRSGKNKEGEPWSNIIPADYGYFKGTIGKDKDHIDVFMGENLESDKVYVVDQVDEKGAFDEHKVMMGYNSISEARNAYNEAYDEGWKGLGAISRTTKDGLKEWFKGNTKKPFAKVEDVKFRVASENPAVQKMLDKLQAVQDLGKAAERIQGLEREAKEALPSLRQTILDQILALKEGAKLGTKDTKEMIKEVQKIITDYAKKSMPLGEAGARDIGSILTLIKEAQTPEAIEKAFERIDELTGHNVDKIERKKYVSKVNRILKWMTGLKKSGTKKVGKFNYVDTKAFQELKDVNNQTVALVKKTNSYKASEVEKAEAQAGLEKLWDDLNEKPEKNALDDVMMKLIELRKLGSKASPKLAQIVSEELEAIYLTAKEAKSQVDMIKGFERWENKEAVKSFLQNDRSLKKLPWYKRAMTQINTGVADIMGNWETLMTMIGGTELRDKMSFMLNEADITVGKQQTNDALLNAAKDIYSVKTKVGTLNMIHELSKTEYELRQPNRKGKPGAGDAMELSKLHLMDIYNALKNPDVEFDYYMSYGEISLAEDGSQDREAQMANGRATIDALIENLSVADRAFADTMQTELDKYYDRLNEIHIKLYNRDLPRVENYWPSTAEREQDIDVMEQMFVESRHPSSTKERTAHRTPMPQDAFNKFTKHVEEAEWYANMSMPVMEANRLFKDNNIKALIKDMRGKNFYKNIEESLQNVTLMPPGKMQQKSKLTAMLNPLLNNWVASKIGATPSVPLKQLLSAVNYAENMPSGQWAKGFVKGLVSPKDTWKAMMDIPYLKARFGDGYSEAVQRALNGDENVHKSKVTNFHQAFKQLMTIGTRYGDITAIVFGGKPYLDYLLKQGMSDKEAVDKFLQDTLRSQQSPFASTLSKLQNSKNPFFRAIFAFSNTPSQYMRKLFEANQNLRVQKKQLEAGKITQEEYNKTKKKTFKAHTIYALVNTVTFTMAGSLINAFMRGSDADDEIWKDMLNQLGQTYTGGLPVIKDLIGGMTRQILGMPIYDDSKPFVEGLDEVVTEGIKISKGESKDLDKSYEKVGQGVATMLAVPYYNLKKDIKAIPPFREQTFSETRVREVGYKLTDLKKDKDIRLSNAANDLKKAYSSAKRKAKQFKSKGNHLAARKVDRLITKSQIHLWNTNYSIGEMKMELKMFNRMSDRIK